MELIEALRSLDPLNDDHWTKDDDARIDVVSKMVGRPVTRQEIIDAAPSFNRENGIPAPVEEKTEESQHQLQEFLDGDINLRRYMKYLRDLPSDELENTVSVLSEMLSDVESRISRGEALKRELKQCVSMTKVRISREVPDVSNQEAIRLYIQKQHESRGGKFQKVTELKKLVDLRNLDPRAPIDAAMARNTKRGTKRPVR